MEIKFDEAGSSGGAGGDALKHRSEPGLAFLVVEEPYLVTNFILYVLYALPAFLIPVTASGLPAGLTSHQLGQHGRGLAKKEGAIDG